MKKKMKIGGLILVALLVLMGGMFYHERRQLHLQEQQATKREQKLQQRLVATKETLKQQKIKQKYVNPIDDQKLDVLSPAEQRFVAQQLTTDRFSGTMLVVRNNHPVYQAAFGYADYAKRRLNTAQTTYQIASIQKSITAALVMRAVQEGKLDVWTPLSKYYPQIPNANQITLKMMLDMRSGIHEMAVPNESLSDQKRIEYALGHLTVKQIGKQNYDAINYLLLAGILEQVTHQSYRTLMEQQVIQPLHLTGFDFMPNLIYNQQAIGYNAQNGNYEAPINVPAYVYERELGTGNMYATASGLFRVEQAIVQGKIFKPALLKTLRTETNGSYTGGVYNFKDYFMSHGVESGFDTSLKMAKDGRSGIILLSNCYKAKPAIEGLNNRLYGRLIAN